MRSTHKGQETAQKGRFPHSYLELFKEATLTNSIRHQATFPLPLAPSPRTHPACLTLRRLHTRPARLPSQGLAGSQEARAGEGWGSGRPNPVPSRTSRPQRHLPSQLHTHAQQATGRQAVVPVWNLLPSHLDGATELISGLTGAKALPACSRLRHVQSGLLLWKVLQSRCWQRQLMGPYGPTASFTNKVLLVHSSADTSSAAALC